MNLPVAITIQSRKSSKKFAVFVPFGMNNKLAILSLIHSASSSFNLSCSRLTHFIFHNAKRYTSIGHHTEHISCVPAFFAANWEIYIAFNCSHAKCARMSICLLVFCYCFCVDSFLKLAQFNFSRAHIVDIAQCTAHTHIPYQSTLTRARSPTNRVLWPVCFFLPVSICIAHIN